MSWETLKNDPAVSWYPSKPFDIPVDRSCWFTLGMALKLIEVLHSLESQPKVIELGTFTGAGSSATMLVGRPDLKLVCVDDFKIIGPDCQYRPNGDTPFFLGQGTVWQHFVNNTWAWRDRVIPFAVRTAPPCLQKIYEHIPDAAAVYIDSDHNRAPVRRQLAACLALWPKAILILDDYNDEWPGVKAAVADLVSEGKLQVSTFHEVAAGRLFVIDPRGTA